MVIESRSHPSVIGLVKSVANGSHSSEGLSHIELLSASSELRSLKLLEGSRVGSGAPCTSIGVLLVVRTLTPPLKVREDVLLGRVSYWHIEAFDNVNEDFCFLDCLERDCLLLNDSRLELAASAEQLIKEGKKRICAA